MVPYNQDKTPTLTPWAGTSMNASIVLDQPGNTALTNLDHISGRVIVRSTKSADISSILVKLEGESRTRLLAPERENGERPKPQVEYHKILYKVSMVFPPANILEGRSHMVGKAAYTLSPGQHEYNFNFKIPFNNSCTAHTGQMPIMMGLDAAKPATRHVKKTLPPTLSGFPGEAEIRYFVKATVNRHSFFKENPRAYAPFNFFPVEPPRAPVSGAEVYARQKHSFNAFPPNGEKSKGKMKSLFNRTPSAPSSPIGSPEAPFVSVDARLPEPSILTCNQDVPLRIIVKKLNEYDSVIYLQSLQILLIANTKIRAHDVFRTEPSSTIIMSKSNMGIPIGSPSDPVNTETVLDDSMWRGQNLPNVVAPSFETCNISRSYQLDVRVGLSYGGNMLSGSKPQSVVLPLRLDTLVYSGIAPPPEVLERMAEAKTNINRPMSFSSSSSRAKPSADTRRPSEFGANQVPPTPIDEDEPASPAYPAQMGSQASSSALQDQYDDAPPSYEDAVASDLPPIQQGGRPLYAPPAADEDALLNRDEKRGWVN